VESARALLDEHSQVHGHVQKALGAIRSGLAREELASIPVSRLRDVTDGRLRIGSIERAGYTTVGQVLDAGRYRLQLLPGVGARTAAQVHAAARQIAKAVVETVGVRIDVDQRDPPTTELLVALNRLVDVGPDLPRACDAARDLQEELVSQLLDARLVRSPLRMLFAGRDRRLKAREAIARIKTVLDRARAREIPLLLAQTTADLLRPPASDVEAWVDFEYRSPEYYNLVAEMAARAGDYVAAEGFLPDDLAARVRAHELDDTHRRVSLRGYQSFGARFALVQRRVILGDEMGLGKSIEAIAVLAHLKARGDDHFLVVCPTSVLINWVREIESRSTLQVFPVHGVDRVAAQEEWGQRGGVAVTTLDSLHWLRVPPGVSVGLLVVDEAHYVKNPRTKRSQAVAEWCVRTERVLFLTGTPMENRVEEFRSLVAYLQPELAGKLRGGDMVAGAQAFRKAVAPVYLRRNQQDVLAELPDLVQVDEWVEFSGADDAAYRDAVASGHFMTMRRAAYAVPETSAKLKRLTELVDDAAANGLKVVIFAFFRDVLAGVDDALGHRAHGPIHGGMTATRRQQVVDEFTRASGHAILLSQIQAGGIGLNLQAASVVIICEPQIKPTMESQAVARLHRMGQVRKVQVHRILAVDSVDQRMLEILGSKKALFDAYARRSDLAESTPDAMDVSEQSLARQVVEEEQRRLAIDTSAHEVAPDRPVG
jgi:superfamily II DNA or RNA helicase